MVSHVTEVAEGVHRLTNGVANFYLIQDSGKLVLVDAGAPKDWALFTQAALGWGKAVGDLDAVLLTHSHTDHTGFAEQAAPLPGPGCGSTSTTCGRRAPGRSGHGESWTGGVEEAIRQARAAGLMTWGYAALAGARGTAVRGAG